MTKSSLACASLSAASTASADAAFAKINPRDPVPSGSRTYSSRPANTIIAPTDVFHMGVHEKMKDPFSQKNDGIRRCCAKDT